MPGYSGTPLPKKLGIKPGFRVYLVDAPSETRADLKTPLAACELMADAKSPIDFVMVFAKSSAHLNKEFKRTAKLLAPAGIITQSPLVPLSTLILG